MNEEHTQLNISLEDTLPVVCNECGNESLQQAVFLRKVPALLTGTGQPSFIPIHVFACTKCGHVNDEFRPKEVKSLDEE